MGKKIGEKNEPRPNFFFFEISPAHFENRCWPTTILATILATIFICFDNDLFNTYKINSLSHDNHVYLTIRKSKFSIFIFRKS